MERECNANNRDLQERWQMMITLLRKVARRNGWICMLSLIQVMLACSRCQNDAETWVAGLQLSEDTIPYKEVFGELEQEALVICNDVDLKGKVCCLPEGMLMKFCGGVIKNGALVGNGNKIEITGKCFERVRISGTWDVPEISTSMFKDLNYDNSLKDVVALANPAIANRIVIEEGDYQVSAQRSGETCLAIGNNTKLLVNGTIRLTPNVFQSYHIIEINGENIAVSGKGIIAGDKHTHVGNAGEWGMGIMIRHASNVRLSGLTIKDCWGDCVYVGGNSKKVLIENCHLDHGRRQGISITSADGVTVKDCTISNVGGTAPEYAIDIEPNRGNSVNHIVIDNVVAKDCKGGIGANKNAEDAWIGNVTIRNCTISAVRKAMANLNTCDTVIIENNDMAQELGKRGIVCRGNNHVVVVNNSVRYNSGAVLRLWELARKIKGKEEVLPIDVDNCGTTVIAGNQEHRL